MMKTTSNKLIKNSVNRLLVLSIILFISLLGIQPASAHCDSFDGPALLDAAKALETNNVELIKKWIRVEDEAAVVPLFHKTYSLKDGDPMVYEIVRTHFYETFVRLHREMEGAPFTGLKAAGTTAHITVMSDNALESGDFKALLTALNRHINGQLMEKYEKVSALYPVKDRSVEEGRAYVSAYIDYTHAVEAVHDILETGGMHKH
jgi:hypothetical protein